MTRSLESSIPDFLFLFQQLISFGFFSSTRSSQDMPVPAEGHAAGLVRPEVADGDEHRQRGARKAPGGRHHRSGNLGMNSSDDDCSSSLADISRLIDY